MNQLSLFEHFIKILKQRQDDVKELMARGAVTVWKNINIC